MNDIVSAEALEFLNNHELATLSTLSRSGQVQGATVYYHLHDDYLYILTKSDSAKAHNMLGHHQVALTMFDADQIQTVQLEGEAQLEADPETKRLMFASLAKSRQYQGETLPPPVAQLTSGGFILFKIKPTRVTYTDYKATAR